MSDIKHLPDIPIHLHASQTLNKVSSDTMYEAKLLLDRCISRLDKCEFPCYVNATIEQSNGYYSYTTNLSDDSIQLVVKKLINAGYQAEKKNIIAWSQDSMGGGRYSSDVVRPYIVIYKTITFILD